MNPAGELYYTDVLELSNKDGISTYEIKNESGTGMLSCYFVAPGLYICYNDIHLSYVEQNYVSKKNILQIHHCAEGRVEYEMQDNTFGYIKPGNIAVYNWKNKPVKSTFPISHYHGLSILLDLDMLIDENDNLFGNFNIDFLSINENFCNKPMLYITEASEEMDHLFSELYAIPEKVKLPYIKLKITELLMMLSNQLMTSPVRKELYYKSSTVEKIKSIAGFLSEDLTMHYSISEISDRFSISQTTLKTTFKGVYGKPIYQYLKELRMTSAAYMLKNTEYSIAEISKKSGYENSSKFTAAFKSVFNSTPTAYRKSGYSFGVLDTALKFKR